ncbi:larval cuticle protein A3A-like [Ornithodoros turicata]|uniref:larval cuticle protein A3A-like n=1 Tax=Ornithodoros turicata TaxID=34597 RepID=UPI003138FC0C
MALPSVNVLHLLITLQVVGVLYGRAAAEAADALQNEIPSGGKRVQYQVQDHAGKGTYKFGYDTGDDPAQHFRQEERAQDGTVRGRYGFVDPNGYLRVVEYVADESGFHVIHTKTEIPKFKTRTVTRPHTPFLGPLPPFIPKPDRDDA